jgi:hypothetical protein
MTLAITKIADFLRANLDLPPGYKVEVDRKTWNILVTNDQLGFAITETYMREHPVLSIILDAVSQQLAFLKEATHPVTTVHGGISTLGQLADDRNHPTKFDETKDAKRKAGESGGQSLPRSVKAE